MREIRHLKIDARSRKIHTHTDIATYRLNWPWGRFSEIIQCSYSIPCISLLVGKVEDLSWTACKELKSEK